MCHSFSRQFFLLSFVFLVHRLVSIDRLLVDQDASLITLVKALLVGMSSDAWISLVVCIGMLVVRKSAWVLGIRRAVAGALCFIFFVVTFVLILGHQSYVDFFRHQMLLEHFSYLLDRDFLSANGQSFFSIRSGLIFLSIAVAVLALSSRFWFLPKTRAYPKLFKVALLVTGLVLHMLNIRYRDQWFIENQLQLNVAENLLRQLENRTPITPLTATERISVDQILKSFDSEKDTKALSRVLPVEELRQAMSIKKNMPFHVIIVLAESFRPSETGWFSKEKGYLKPSLTPRFDEISREGFLFTSAYSTSTVTRTGQEAIWCGVHSTPESSLMRQFTRTKVTCLPKLLNQFTDISTLWVHGGEGAFDGQATFWRSQQTAQVIDRHQFKTHGPIGGWGYSDRTLFEEGLLRLHELDQNSNLRIVHSMLLTMSNHIPWSLPTDTPKTLSESKFEHPQHATTAYFDFALGEFVDQLKKTDLWQRSVLLVVSDHGNLETPYAEFSGHKDQRRPELLTHINILVSGGLFSSLENIESIPVEKRLIHEPVSQAEIANFLGKIMTPENKRLKFPFFLSSLGNVFSTPVVWSSVEKGVYFPEQNTFIAKIPPSLDHLGSDRLKLGIADYRNQQALITGLEKQ